MAALDSSAHPARPLAAATTGRTGLGRLLAVSILVWIGVALFQTLAFYSDYLRAGRDADFFGLLAEIVPLYLPWMVFSVVFHQALERSQPPLLRPARILGWLLVTTVVFMAPYEVYLVSLEMRDKGLPMSQLLTGIAQYSARSLFVDFLLFLSCFAAIYAIVVFQRTLADERARRRIEAENLALRLQVEEGRLAALQAQLEPHFMFNALNALSALVRAGQQASALSAIQQLGELLRYAIAASDKEWVSVDEEVAFVQDYLSLQRLRYGERLQFVIEGLSPEVLRVECLPLLLQPLVENAIRHDLENHAEASQIRLSLRCEGPQLVVVLRNPHRGQAPANKGLGVGLANIRSRLALVYGEAAELRAQVQDGDFEVSLRFPRERGE